MILRHVIPNSGVRLLSLQIPQIHLMYYQLNLCTKINQIVEFSVVILHTDYRLIRKLKWRCLERVWNIIWDTENVYFLYLKRIILLCELRYRSLSVTEHDVDFINCNMIGLFIFLLVIPEENSPYYTWQYVLKEKKMWMLLHLIVFALLILIPSFGNIIAPWWYSLALRKTSRFSRRANQQ